MPTVNVARTIRGMLVLTVLALVGAMFTVVSWPAPARAVLSSAPADPGSITLHVQAARSVGTAAGLVHEGDAVTSYKWIINKDDAGDPGTADHQLLDKCLPPRAVGGASDPDYADTCPWPSVRNTSEPEKASRFQSDRDHPPRLSSDQRDGGTQRATIRYGGHAVRGLPVL